jgi:hypothetical protein
MSTPIGVKGEGGVGHRSLTTEVHVRCKICGT